MPKTLQTLLRVQGLKPKDAPNLFGPRGLNLELAAGEFLVVLGKSGHGKSTFLELVLGTRPKCSGKIDLFLDSEWHELEQGRDFKLRNFGILFQDLALFESKTVWENLIFPLRVHGVPREQWDAKIREQIEELHLGSTEGLRTAGRDDPKKSLRDKLQRAVLDQLFRNRGAEHGLEKDILKKTIRDLSGGQKQRVALARLMLVDRRIYLFDEPLSSIDNPLRQFVVKKLLSLKERLKKQGGAAIYVTHSQAEALSLADRIIILRENFGIEADDKPDRIYHSPRTRFVAEFVGDPLYNFLPIAKKGNSLVHLNSASPILILERDGCTELSIAHLHQRLNAENVNLLDSRGVWGRLALGFRPEAVFLQSASLPQIPCIQFQLESRECMFQGEEIIIYAEDRDNALDVQIQLDFTFADRFIASGVAKQQEAEFLVPLKDTSLFFFPQGFISKDYDETSPGFNVTSFKYKYNVFGHEIIEPLYCWHDAIVGPRIKNELKRLFHYLTDDHNRADLFLARFTELARCAKTEREVEASGYRFLIGEERVGALIHSKLDERAQRIVEQVAPLIIGQSILDIGSGDGLVGQALSSNGRTATLYDVCDYRDPRATCKFLIGTQEEPVPLDQAFDSVLLLTVLHHAKDPHSLFAEVRNLVRHRLIIIESVFGVSREEENQSVWRAPLTRPFLDMDHGSQLMFISFFDWFYNRVLHREVCVPFNFSTPREWRRFFDLNGFEVNQTIHLGVDQPLVPEYHVLYSLQPRKAK